MTHIEREILFETSSEVLDVITLLTSSHKELLTKFSDYEQASSVINKQHIVESISSQIIIGMQAEEEIFYPAAKRVLKEKGIVSALIMHHAVLKYLLDELKSISAASDIHDIKVRVLGENVKQYIKEKQTKLFPKVIASGKLDLWMLGTQFLAHRKKN